jgi:hypothetical protein
MTVTQDVATPSAGCEAPEKVTRSLLGWGVVAGPLYVGAALVQALTRDGFDIGRHDVSLLANGRLGWIQVANFLLTGLMVIACAVGMRRALRTGRTWGPLLVGTYGAGLVAAGVFRADPAMGFPPGTPEDAHAISWHGTLHFVAAAIGFLALVAACFVLARLGGRRWAAYSVTTGVVFLAAFAGIAAGSGHTWAVLGFWAGVVVAWAWILVMSVRLTRELVAS